MSDKPSAIFSLKNRHPIDAIDFKSHVEKEENQFKRFMRKEFPKLKKMNLVYEALSNVFGPKKYDWASVLSMVKDDNSPLSYVLRKYIQIDFIQQRGHCDEKLIKDTLNWMKDSPHMSNYLFKYIYADLQISTKIRTDDGTDPRVYMEELSNQGFPLAGQKYALMILHDSFSLTRNKNDDYFITLDKTLKILRKLSEIGFAPAQYSLSMLFSDNLILLKEGEDIEHLMTKASNQGYPEAMYVLGLWHMTGEVVEESNEKACRYLERAATSNWSLSNYMFRLDSIHFLWMIYKGEGRIPSIEWENSMLEYLMKYGYTKSMFTLGKMYFEVCGEERSFEKAFEIFNRLKQKEPESDLYLGMMYYCGQGTEQSYHLAVKHLRRAVANGIPEAAYYLTFINHNGKTNESSKYVEFFSKTLSMNCTKIPLKLEHGKWVIQ